MRAEVADGVSASRAVNTCVGEQNTIMAAFHKASESRAFAKNANGWAPVGRLPSFYQKNV